MDSSGGGSVQWGSKEAPGAPFDNPTRYVLCTCPDIEIHYASVKVIAQIAIGSLQAAAKPFKGLLYQHERLVQCSAGFCIYLLWCQLPQNQEEIKKEEISLEEGLG